MELCEWNPEYDVAATLPSSPGDCQNEATLRVRDWHLCQRCADLPTFKRYKQNQLRSQHESSPSDRDTPTYSTR